MQYSCEGPLPVSDCTGSRLGLILFVSFFYCCYFVIFRYSILGASGDTHVLFLPSWAPLYRKALPVSGPLPCWASSALAYHDYAWISQFHGGWFLHGKHCSDESTLFLLFWCKLSTFGTVQRIKVTEETFTGIFNYRHYSLVRSHSYYVLTFLS
jgi:hypothetical protein